jgi:RecJ-like exonuclease
MNLVGDHLVEAICPRCKGNGYIVVQEAMAKIREAMKNAPNEDMKRIWRKHYDAIDKKIIKEELNEKF